MFCEGLQENQLIKLVPFTQGLYRTYSGVQKSENNIENASVLHSFLILFKLFFITNYIINNNLSEQ